MNKLTGIAVFLLLLGLLHPTTGRETPERKEAPPMVELRPFRHMILDSAGNGLIDSGRTLASFFEKLARLHTTPVNDGSEVVSIFHLGDSHIQAGFLTGTVMRNFHADFGNAGRGLITPLKIAKTNEPFDYIIRSDNAWNSARCIQTGAAIPIGLGGVSISSRDSLFSLTVGSMEREDIKQYGFNRVRVLHHPRAPRLDVDENEFNPLARYITRNNPHMTTIQLPGDVTNLKLLGKSDKEFRDSAVYYGFILENGKNGVLYHAAGINGAQFLHWSRTHEWSDQSSLIDPSLIVLSMGTNESLRGNGFNKEVFKSEIHNIVSRLREKNPNAVILLTTPAECFIRRRVNGRTTYVENPLSGKISEAIVEYALENSIACWDLYSVAGGPGSSKRFLDARLFGKDRLHFTVEGYETIGHYFYHALIQEYNHYVAELNG